MINVMHPNEREVETATGVDSQLWQVCAGGLLQLPLVNSKAFYFVQGHIEQVSGYVDLRNCPRIPPYIMCKVESINYLADSASDEVFAKIRLVPLGKNETDVLIDDDVTGGIIGSEPEDKKPTHFAKTLTQSDANNGGGFSVPRYCAETIFPRLDYKADPPVQNIIAKDVHGEPWRFRHIYRGTPRRHLLTTGWSTFVNAKKLVAGDSIVFLRADNGDLCVGIRRAKRGGLGMGRDLSSSGWNPSVTVMQYAGIPALLRDDENSRLIRNGNCNGNSLDSGASMIGKAKVSAESVLEAAARAANGQPFEVVYYPRAGTPEFVVKAANVKTALQIRWCVGMRIRMPFETEDSSRVSWFSGTISSVQVTDPLHWPDSPWRLLQVTWDEPDLLQNVKRVSPWLVDLVSNMPAIHLSPFSPPRKKFRLPQHPDYPMDGQLSIPTGPSNFLGPNNLFGCLSENSPAGMQGARHISVSDIHMNRFHSVVFPAGFPGLDPAAAIRPVMNTQNNGSSSEIESCLLTVGSSAQTRKKPDDSRAPSFVLFGQTILTEEQMLASYSGDTVSPNRTEKSSSEGNVDKPENNCNGSGSAHHSSPDRMHCYEENRREMAFNLETDLCKVFMGTNDVGQKLDLSGFNSYEELRSKLMKMYGIECHDHLTRLVYQDAAGSDKSVGTEPFCEFAKRAKRLTILIDSSCGEKIQA